MIVESAPVDGWCRVYVDGSWGYMSADYLTLAETMDVSAHGWVDGTEVRMRAAASTGQRAYSASPATARPWR